MADSNNSLCQEETFTKVFHEYSQTLFNYIYYKCGDRAQAEDLTQEAFLKLWKNCKNVSYETAKGYVFRTANNKLLNIYSHQKVVLNFEKINRIDKTNESPEFLMEEKELHQAIMKGISDLPEKQRVVFLLSRIDKKTYREIAEIIGISKQAVEKRIYKALDTMRQISVNIN